MLRGVVRERLASGPGLTLPGVRLHVRYKTGAGPSTRSSQDGSFELKDVASTFFELQGSKDGYETTTVVGRPPAEGERLDLGLPPILRTLTGAVTETFPTETTAVRGAIVTVLTGSNKDKRAGTNERGIYELQVWGDFDVSTVATGYEPTRTHVAATTNHLDVSLRPDSQPITTRLTGQLCADSWWWNHRPGYEPGYDCVGAVQAHHFLPLHRGGAVVIQLRWTYEEDYSEERMWLEVQCAGARLLEALYSLQAVDVIAGVPPRVMFPTVSLQPLSVVAPGAGLCEIKPSRYASFKGAVARTEYQIDIVHPK